MFSGVNLSKIFHEFYLLDPPLNGLQVRIQERSLHVSGSEKGRVIIVKYILEQRSDLQGKRFHQSLIQQGPSAHSSSL